MTAQATFDCLLDDRAGAFPEYAQDALTPEGRAHGHTADEWTDFEAWRHTPNGREVSNLVVRYALQMRRGGWTKYGIEAIANRIRWDQDLKHGPDADGFKVNNNWKRRLAIWAMTRSADLDGFFRLREGGG